MEVPIGLSTLEENKKNINSWMEEFNFYETEIDSCELSLEELIMGIKSKETLAEAEHFQNQLIHQRQIINDLKLKSRRYLVAIPTNGQPSEAGNHSEYFSRLEAEVVTFRDLFKDLLVNFDAFLGKVTK